MNLFVYSEVCRQQTNGKSCLLKKQNRIETDQELFVLVYSVGLIYNQRSTQSCLIKLYLAYTDKNPY